MKRWLIAGLLLAGLSGCSDERAEQAKALEAELRTNLASLAPAGTAPGLLFETLTLTPAQSEADGFAGRLGGVVLEAGDGSKIPVGDVGFTLKPEGDNLRHYSDLTLPETISAKLADGTEFTLKLAGPSGGMTWSNAYETWVAADVATGRVEFALPAEKLTMSADSTAYTLATKEGTEGRVDQNSSFTAKGIAFDSPDASGTAASATVDSVVTGAKMAELVELNADYRKAIGAKDMKALGEVLTRMSRALGGVEVRFAAETFEQKDPVAKERFAVARSGLRFGVAGLDGAQSAIRLGFDYDGLEFAEPIDPVDDMSMLLPLGVRLDLDFQKVPTEKLIQLAAESAAETGDSPEALQLAGMMFVMGIQGALAEAGTELHIADSLIRTAEAETTIAGLLLMDPAALMGATGAVELEVAGFEKLAARIERLVGPEFAGWLRQVAVEKPKDGDKRAVFALALAPDGSVTVNGQPLPE
jgi:hypothetical protein